MMSVLSSARLVYFRFFILFPFFTLQYYSLVEVCCIDVTNGFLVRILYFFVMHIYIGAMAYPKGISVGHRPLRVFMKYNFDILQIVVWV